MMPKKLSKESTEMRGQTLEEVVAETVGDIVQYYADCLDNDGDINYNEWDINKKEAEALIWNNIINKLNENRLSEENCTAKI